MAYEPSEVMAVTLWWGGKGALSDYGFSSTLMDYERATDSDRLVLWISSTFERHASRRIVHEALPNSARAHEFATLIWQAIEDATASIGINEIQLADRRSVTEILGKGRCRE